MPGPMASGSTSMRLLLLAPVMMAAVLIPVSAQAADDTLCQSVQQLRRFPFRPDCDGNTQEIVACLWRQLNVAGSSPVTRFWTTAGKSAQKPLWHWPVGWQQLNGSGRPCQTLRWTLSQNFSDGRSSRLGDRDP